jgi:uncharacterized protein YxeA
MAGYSLFEIQKAIDTILIADATLLSLLGTSDENSVYDNPGQITDTVIYPYVVYTSNTAVPFDTKTSNGTDATITISAYSKSGDKEEVSSIIKRLHDLLHNAQLTVQDNDSLLCRWDEFSTIEIDDNDLEIYQGSIRFRAITTEVII